MKRKSINILFLLLIIISCQNSRPHGGNEIPPLSRNNYLMGFLNEHRASYDVTYYDINIDFDIENKSLDGFVTIKAKSLNDIDTLQVDLIKDLDIKRITHKNNELEYSREEDAVSVIFPNKNPATKATGEANPKSKIQIITNKINIIVNPTKF